MNLTKLYTSRWQSDNVSYHLVYEWEDVLAESLSLDLIGSPGALAGKVLRLLPALFRPGGKGEAALVFEMSATQGQRGAIYLNNAAIVPWVIDYFLDDAQREQFCRRYDKHRLVLVSSREVYEHLKNKGCTLPLAHLALSISDKYRITTDTRFEKTYDTVLMGRQNPVLEGWLKTYAASHTDFLYVYRKITVADGKREFHYYTSDGQHLGNIESRADYMALMRKSRIGLYATPDIDTDHRRTNGFDQVTPRFLEYIACGCHVVARYGDNPDTRWYGLRQFSPCVSSYGEFEEAIDRARATDVDMKAYNDYLDGHYTSRRADLLREIISHI